MTDEQQLFHRMHKAKIKVAIATSLLIGAAFLSVFVGLLKVDIGVTNGNLVNYRTFHIPIPAQGEEPPHLLAYTGRVVSEYANGEEYGNDRFASIIRLDIPTGTQLLNFSAPEPSMRVAYIDSLNEWHDGHMYPPCLLVQFARVQPIETVDNQGEGDIVRYRFHNETGTYRTFIWDVTGSAVAGSTLEITGALGAGSRVIGVIRLPYNEVDHLPDFIVITTNRTWQEAFLRQEVPSGTGVLYRLHAMHANGSLAWQARSDQAGSLIEMNDDVIWHEQTSRDREGISTFGFAINATHFVVQHPVDKLVSGEIATGTLAWHAQSIKTLIDFPHDHSGDGIPDIACVNASGHACCLNGLDGSILSNPTMSLGSTEVQSMRSTSRFGTSFDHFMVRDTVEKKLRMYKHDGSGFSQEYEIDLQSYEFHGWDQAWQGYYNYTGTPLLCLHIGRVDGKGDDYRLCNAMDGTMRFSSSQIKDSSIIGDFFEQWDGVESITVEDNGGYKAIAIELGSLYMFEIDLLNAIVLYAGIIVGVISGIALIKASRTYSRLSRQEDRLQPELARQERSIITTSATTKPLRALSTVLLLVVLVSTIMFVTFIIIIGMGENFYESANYYAVRNGYITISLTLVSLPLIAVLYNHLSPRSAMLYIKIQRFFYQRILRGKKEYKVVVLDMIDYAKRFSIGSIFARSLFPLLVSITLGLTVFGAFASDTTGMGGTTGSINVVWLSEFEMYAGLTFIASYMLMMLISPGGWLLDDSGVVYFEQPVDTHQPGDISKISDWLTGWLKGFFGFTALLNYYQLFAGTDLTTLVNMNDPVQAFMLIVFVFAIMIIASPILYGFIAMFSANASMIDDLEYNRCILYDKLRKAGIDVTPKRLKDFFEK